MFIETDAAGQVGDTISVQFTLREGARLVECLATVVRVHTPDGAGPGMAVEFIGLNPESRQTLSEILRRTQDLEPK
jgi:hypothetical protein